MNDLIASIARIETQVRKFVCQLPMAISSAAGQYRCIAKADYGGGVAGRGTCVCVTQFMHVGRFLIGFDFRKVLVVARQGLGEVACRERNPRTNGVCEWVRLQPGSEVLERLLGEGPPASLDMQPCEIH